MLAYTYKYCKIAGVLTDAVSNNCLSFSSLSPLTPDTISVAATLIIGISSS